MTRNLSIKLKALFLLIVFASNTAVGFACALGMDMGFNTSHHNETEEPAEVHIHADGKKHVHEKETPEVTTHVHQDGSKHQHEDEATKQVPAGKSISFTKGAGGCCSNEVQKFQNLDKTVAANTSINVPAFIAVLSVFLDIDISNGIKYLPTKCTARFYYPPPPDIRIAIQRFQI
ncbi:MAG: hypothetical protein J0H85_04335 [Sediminibacterium magnilacihabitans]|jgi:hypothetical protein|nr:hypothetical protein [Sediminibacterium magnilacihabitans]PQV61874.1 hypothetical protein CLV53_101148 [Sediminibacterium magnilacihabitans]